jgi:hypothetical protein
VAATFFDAAIAQLVEQRMFRRFLVAVRITLDSNGCVAILENNDVLIWTLKAHLVGYVLYEDEHQMVAEPSYGMFF